MNKQWDENEPFDDSSDYYFPAFNNLGGGLLGVKYYEASFFGQHFVKGKKKFGEPHYRQLKIQFEKENLGN